MAVSLVQGVSGVLPTSVTYTTAGGTSTTVQNKLNEFLTTQDYGADPTGTANSASNLNTAFATNKNLIGTTGTYTSSTSVTFGSQTYSTGYATTHTSTATDHGYQLESGSQVEGGQWNCTGNAPTWNVATTVNNASIRNALIQNTSTSNSISVYLDAANITNVQLTGTYITSNGYGVLTNPGGSVDGLMVTGNIIRTAAEPVEINAPSGAVHQNITVSGNVLAATVAGSGHISGFGVGIAAGKNIAVVGNSIPQSGWEAFHIEDAQYNLAFVGNVAQNVSGDGFQAGQGPGTGDGIVAVGNQLKSASSAAGTYGFNMTYTGSGSLPGSIVSNNKFTNFPVGILGSSTDSIYANNVVNTATTAGLEANGGGWMYGTNLIKNSATLIKSLQSTVIGGVLSDSNPTTILDTSAHTAGTMGTTIKDEVCFRGLSASVPGTTGGTTTAISLFTLPKLLRGRIIVRATNQANAAGWVYASADLTWDGTTLTVASNLTKANGTFANATPFFTNSTGSLAIEMYSSNNGALTFTFDVIFKGEWFN